MKLWVLRKVTEHSGRRIDTKKLTWDDWRKKLLEEVDELVVALHQKDKLNITEELMDVLQICIGMMAKLVRENIDITQVIHRHNKKLANRGCEPEEEIHFNIKKVS